MDSKTADMRRDYQLTGLTETDVSADPIEQFSRWFEVASAHDQVEANAMTLATGNAAGQPSARTVLLKAFDEQGFVFYTNLTSRKAADLQDNPQAALLFWWRALERQIRIEGSVEPVPHAMAEEYFSIRPRGSQLGAWASRQSAVIPNRAWLEEHLSETESTYADQEVPCPPFWGGYRVRPQSMEFWQGRASRLHDRLRYRLQEGGWCLERLSP